MKKPELSDEDSDDEVTGEIGVAIEEFKEESKKIEVIYRTFSFLIEFLFAYSIYHLILQDYLSPIFNNVISEIFLLVENLPIVYFILEDLRPLIPIWALYGVLRCLSVLFLKVSWSQKILGFKAQSKNALANMSREFLGLIIGQSILFYLVLLFSC